MRRLFVSFSGGETSGFMTYYVTTRWRDRYDEIAVVFANTGQENEETLEFVERCDKHWGLGVVWVEADVHHGVRKNPSARIVNFETASRNGEPFEEIIKKYGIPNSKFKHCTRALKLRPMEDYLKSIGWEPGSYDTVIGIRKDEIDRMAKNARERRILYPLVSEYPMAKPDINAFWAAMPFRLRLKGYQGNCKWCWKKSFRKHFTLLGESPEDYEFPDRMERLYGDFGPEFRHDPATRRDPLPEGYRRTFFRENKSVQDLIRDRLDKIASGTFEPAVDDAVAVSDFDPELDLGAGCTESCEVFSGDDEDEYDPEVEALI